MKDKITVIGSLNYDIILKISRLPYKGETLPVNEAAYSAGGKGANQAVANLDEVSDTEMQKLTGGVSFPGLF